ncbi:MAG: RHS repeat-associated core domain-containing protein, partial [Paracoccaceae bacterium]
PHPAVKLLNGVTPAVATYLHRDGLASVRAITNAAGAKIEAALYKPFGEQSEWVLPGNAAPETKGWIGERYDADAGLQYLNARYYDPELSLFLQPDWFEVTKKGVGTNRFSYSFNDPVNKLDPGGNDATTKRRENEEDERSNDADYTAKNIDEEEYKWRRAGIEAERAEIERAASDPVDTITNQYAEIFADAALTQYIRLGGTAGPRAKGLAPGMANKGTSAWSLPPLERGKAIEKMMGQNLPDSFPVIDKVGGMIATSIKSMDLNAKTYASAAKLEAKVVGYAKTVGGFQGASYAGTAVQQGVDFTARAVEIAIPHAGTATQRQAIANATARAAAMGVTIITRIID